MISNTEESKNTHNKIKVIGVGCAGGNVVKRMVETGMTNIEFYVVNTDQREINKVNYATTLQIGSNTTHGFGCAGYPVRGRLAAEEDTDKLQQIMQDADIVLVIAGMGGGTGTGAAPVVASISREQGAFTVGIVTLPFNFEGERCIEIAELGLQKLRENADSVLVVSNQRIHDTVKSKLTIADAFGLSNEMLIRCVETIYELNSIIRRKDIVL